jgi:protocatechuate 3,4-dioxygenase beta subunit
MDDQREYNLGLTHDLEMLSRRRMLYVAGVAGASALMAACASTTEQTAAPTSSTTASCVRATPQETTGPHALDGASGPNVLTESGLVRDDIRASFGPYSGRAQGVPISLEMTLKDVAKDCAPGTGMAVYVWQCDREGNYSLVPGRGAADQNYLRGVQVADQQGRVVFKSIFPACYIDRWPHIHVEAFDSVDAAVAGKNARLTSQIALPEPACRAVYAFDPGYAESIEDMKLITLATDPEFGDGWDTQLATVTGDPSTGMTVSITIGVDGP